ncbi:trans-aconitate 2-methyltransferase [Cryobacterium sp. PAMC25264]|uniref:class I SAM-dependent methyltransferase n=1 Tax=Cryobacterium sp. PAMC25264 TaxID=2861288 RepID=UPI001C62D2AA|nr:class I SAM-dependent methyltransferase [Cryobacterium sp. PAMC25264]QYF73189.1 class I SAM-dependent methyltransferase [Cryobacterium sp. PAMC25264]
MHSFDKAYWEEHWDQASPLSGSTPANPYVLAQTHDLPRGRALDAGCGTGAEALVLAADGWQVTGADISAAALAVAADRTHVEDLSGSVTWLEADLTHWTPMESWDLVMTNYAHPAMPQLAFYDHIATWVAPGGTLLIVGHLHEPAPAPSAAAAEHDHHPPHEATVTLADIIAGFDTALWTVDAGETHTRSMGGHGVQLRDVVVRATRRAVTILASPPAHP